MDAPQGKPVTSANRITLLVNFPYRYVICYVSGVNTQGKSRLCPLLSGDSPSAFDNSRGIQWPMAIKRNRASSGSATGANKRPYDLNSRGLCLAVSNYSIATKPATFHRPPRRALSCALHTPARIRRESGAKEGQEGGGRARDVINTTSLQPDTDVSIFQPPRAACRAYPFAGYLTRLPKTYSTLFAPLVHHAFPPNRNAARYPLCRSKKIQAVPRPGAGFGFLVRFHFQLDQQNKLPRGISLPQDKTSLYSKRDFGLLAISNRIIRLIIWQVKSRQ